MTKNELREEFRNESGIFYMNSQEEIDIDYVYWLENKLLAIYKPSRQLLPKGSIISYGGIKAVVIKDKGETLTVKIDDLQEEWYWNYGEITCKIISVPFEKDFEND